MDVYISERRNLFPQSNSSARIWPAVVIVYSHRSEDMDKYICWSWPGCPGTLSFPVTLQYHALPISLAKAYFAEYIYFSLRLIHHCSLLSEAWFSDRAHACPLAELWFRIPLWVWRSCRYGVGWSEDSPQEGCSFLEIKLSSRKSLFKRRWWMSLNSIYSKQD